MQTLRKFDTALGSILEDGGKIMFFIFSAAALLVCLRYHLLAITRSYRLAGIVADNKVYMAYKPTPTARLDERRH